MIYGFPENKHLGPFLTKYIIIFLYYTMLNKFASLFCVIIYQGIYKPTHNHPYCVPNLRNKINTPEYIYYRPTTQPVCTFVLVILLTWYFHRAYYFNTGLMSPHEAHQVCVHYYGQQNLNLTAAWQQYDSCGIQGDIWWGVLIYIGCS